MSHRFRLLKLKQIWNWEENVLEGVFCSLIYFVWFPTIRFASWGEIKAMFCTQISSGEVPLMYSARILGLPPRHDNLWHCVNIGFQQTGHSENFDMKGNNQILFWINESLTYGKGQWGMSWYQNIIHCRFVISLLMTARSSLSRQERWHTVHVEVSRPYTVRSKMTWRMTQMMRLMTSWPAWSPADPIFGPPTIRVFWARSADNIVYSI